MIPIEHLSIIIQSLTMTYSLQMQVDIHPMQKEEINELRDIVKNTQNDVNSELNETADLLESNIEDSKAAIKEK